MDVKILDRIHLALEQKIHHILDLRGAIGSPERARCLLASKLGPRQGSWQNRDLSGVWHAACWAR